MEDDNKYFDFSDMELDPILKYLVPNPNLPTHLLQMSEDFAKLTKEVLIRVPRSAERTTAFRKILEAKDCAVRAML